MTKNDWHIEKVGCSDKHVIVSNGVVIFELGNISHEDAKTELIDHLNQLVSLLEATIRDRELYTPSRCDCPCRRRCVR